MKMVRRAIAATLIVGLVLTLWAFWFEPSRLIVQDERLALRINLHRPIRIAILTDLHVGSPFNGLPKLQAVVDRTNAAQPDLICLLGDLVIQGVRGGAFVTPEAIAGELKRLRAPLGVVGVLGNHDGWLDHDRVARALLGNGVRLVEDTAVKLEGAAGPLWVAGLSDYWGGRHDIAAAIAAITDEAPSILLTHNPDVFPDVPARVSLTLAGHTHGGQVNLPLIGRPIVPSRFGQRFAAGLVNENGRLMYVATGIGTSILPVRFRVPPSIVILTLEAAR